MRLHIVIVYQCRSLQGANVCCVRVVERVVKHTHLVVVLFVGDNFTGRGANYLLLLYLSLDELLVCIDSLKIELLIDVGRDESLLTFRVETRIEGTTCGSIKSILKLHPAFFVRIVALNSWYDCWSCLRIHQWR